MSQTTFETKQPWVVYHFPFTDAEADARGGETYVVTVCAICGVQKKIALTLPPPDVPVQDQGYHPARQQFLNDHVHKLQQTAPETWALPLLNPAAHSDTLDILNDVMEKALRSLPGDG